MQALTGGGLRDTIETGEFAVSPGKRAMISTVIPYLTGSSPTVTGAIGARQRQIDDSTFTSATSLNADGYCPTRSAGAFHRIRMNITGEFDVAQGVAVDAKMMGMR